MGHVRLGVLPAGKKWAEVVRLLEDGANVPELANAIAVAAENEIIAARGDPTLASTVWLLTQLPLAARSDRFAAELLALGFPQGSGASLVNIVAGFSAAVTSQLASPSGRTDLGVLAQQPRIDARAPLDPWLSWATNRARVRAFPCGDRAVVRTEQPSCNTTIRRTDRDRGGCRA